MKDWWLKLGCRITGYNYHLIRNSSEASAKAVKKYLSAIIIICIVWGMLGFLFFQRYMKTDNVGSTIAALVMVIVVVQIERQIILTPGKNKWGKRFRILIALVMAIIGSVLIDQIVFKDDVEKSKISNIQKDVEMNLKVKTAQLENEIANLDILIEKKEKERIDLINEVTVRPFIKSSASARRNYIIKKYSPTGASRDSVVTKTENSLTDIPNPKQNLIPTLDKQIADVRKQKSQKESARITIRQDLEDEFKSKMGILDELTILFSILLSSGVALFIWSCLFVFFLAIELFVLVSKLSDGENDYDKLILHQKDIRIKVLGKLDTNTE